MAQGFNDNLYLIDLSYLNTPAEVVYDLSTILDNDLAKNQRVKLKLGHIDFNKSQLLSIKSLIESINSTLAIVEGDSETTRNSAISAGLVFQNSVDKVKDIMFFSKERNDSQEEKRYQEVKPGIFTEINPIKKEDIIISQNETETEENHESENIYKQEVNNYTQETQNEGESFEIQPQKFEVTEENLNFDENKQEWLETEQESKVQDLAENFSNNNWANTENQNNNEQDANNKQNLIDKVNNLFDNSENASIEEKNTENENQQEIEITEEIAPGIQSLDDIPLDIPTDKTIQEELNVIYNAERKLDDIFAATGLNEDKFKSLKDSPKAEEKEYTQYDFELEAFPTKYLKQTICTGQYISFDGNLVIIGDCHEGSEISASGDITVWGELSGSAHAGKNGNEKCKIRALKMNASQLRISNCYVKRPSVLNDATKVDSIPTEAMIVNGEIAVYKIYK